MNEHFLKTSIIKLCKQPRSFEFLSKNLHGLDPFRIEALLTELEKEEKITQMDQLWVIREINRSGPLPLYPAENEYYLKKYMGYFDFLKTPHPLDFEWRNSSHSLHNLSNRIQKITEPTDAIIILGMPTLFATLTERDIQNKVTIIERNKPVIEGLKHYISDPQRFSIITQDIFQLDPSPIKKGNIIVMDPPWYSPHFFQFIWVAAKLVEVGGIVMISLPPINTRPNIITERSAWFNYCHELGLCLESLEPQTLEYAMPFFEFNALRAGGIKNTMPFWRKGDLAIFRKIADSDHPRKKLEDIIDNTWVELEFDGMRLRVNAVQNTDEPQPFSIDSIVKGDILPSVSARDPRRPSANIFTSGNRIFRTTCPVSFLKHARKAISGGKPECAEEKTTVDFLKVIAQMEKAEFENYLEWIYYEMERQINS